MVAVPAHRAMRGEEWVGDRLLGHLQSPGSYCAVVLSPPRLDDLGIEVAWSDEAHMVVGILDSEDIVK